MVCRSGWVLALTLLAAGCSAEDAVFGGAAETDGGGGGGGDDSEGSGSSSQIPGGDYCGAVDDWDSALADAEDEVIELVNEARAAGGSCGGQAMSPVPPLQSSGPLQCAARVHSKDMFDREFFDHVNPDGEDPFVRMERAGYRYRTAGENIAFNYPSPQQVVAGWLDSPGHCRNIMNEDFSQIGVGYYAESAGGHMWTQTFGLPQ